jgi:3-hydroxyacyl-CoA dehydrogenase
MINEAVYTLYEGVGSVDVIDTAMRLGAHHPMGTPRALALAWRCRERGRACCAQP